MDRLEAQRRLINLESALLSRSLSFSPLREPAVEEARFPSLVSIYWGLVDGNGCPPTQLDFARAVADDPLVSSLPRPAVLARSARTYPSLVRQHHFEYLLRGRFRWVFRGDELDMAGIDLLILQYGRAYGVGLAAETDAGRKWHERKQVRHGELPVPVLDLYVEHERSQVIGDFWLHPPEDVDWVEAFISREEAAIFEDAQHALGRVYRSTDRRPRCSRQDFADGFLGAVGYLRDALTGRDRRPC